MNSAEMAQMGAAAFTQMKGQIPKSTSTGQTAYVRCVANAIVAILGGCAAPAGPVESFDPALAPREGFSSSGKADIAGGRSEFVEDEITHWNAGLADTDRAAKYERFTIPYRALTVAIVQRNHSYQIEIAGFPKASIPVLFRTGSRAEARRYAIEASEYFNLPLAA